MNNKKVLETDEPKTKKVTYDALMNAKTVTETKKKDNFSKIMIIKYIAVTIILFAIIFGSIILFRQM